MEDGVKPAGILNRLLQPESIVIIFISPIFPALPILGIPFGFVIFDCREHEHQRHGRVIKVRLVERPNVFELERA